MEGLWSGYLPGDYREAALFALLALMLLGLALYRWGFLSGGWADRDYWKVIAVGYGQKRRTQLLHIGILESAQNSFDAFLRQRLGFEVPIERLDASRVGASRQRA